MLQQLHIALSAMKTSMWGVWGLQDQLALFWVQHTDKCKCEKTKEIKNKLDKQDKIWTLFDIRVKKVQQPTQPMASLSTRKTLAIPLPIIIQSSKNHSTRDVQSEGTAECWGCLLGWEIIDWLWLAAKRISLSTCWPNTYVLTISFTWLASISHVLQEIGVVRMMHGQKNEHGWGLMCPWMSCKF